MCTKPGMVQTAMRRWRTWMATVRSLGAYVSENLATIVLVHGWCCGAWVWDRLVPLLARARPSDTSTRPTVRDRGSS